MLAGMGNLVAVTLIVGEEEFLVDRAVREALAQARAALAEASGGGDGDLHDLEGSALAQGELAALTSPSLFGGGAVVIIRNAQNAGKEIAAELAKYAKSPAPDAAVILTHAGGAKGKALVTDLAKAGARQVDCPKLTRASERTDFVRNEFRRTGRQAEPKPSAPCSTRSAETCASWPAPSTNSPPTLRAGSTRPPSPGTTGAGRRRPVSAWPTTPSKAGSTRHLNN